MERCDFCSVMNIIFEYYSSDHYTNQSDFLYDLFDSFFEKETLILDIAQVCRWMNGQAPLNSKIATYYRRHPESLYSDIEKNLLPYINDTKMFELKIYNLVLFDPDISASKKDDLFKHYPCSTHTEGVRFISDVLWFTMTRAFIPRDKKTKELLDPGRRSLVIREHILNIYIPKPCKFFCGRARELDELHTLIQQQGKVFLYGIAGIGKSELAKAYASEYRKDYTNVLYLFYSGDLVHDIAAIDFVDDLDTDSPQERFRKHDRYLRSLKEDTLIIIDNFNTTETKDLFFSTILKYYCHILFTTRSKIDDHTSYLLEEIANPDDLFKLFSCFYSNAQDHRPSVEQIINTLHSHTFAVELAARLLERGILSPDTVLHKLQTEKASMNASDRIGVTKDGRKQKATYYEHIHTLFSLYQLSELELHILRGLSLIPLTGIRSHLFAEWMEQPDMNTINDLIETGFVQEQTSHIIALHPLIQEVVVSETQPSVSNCRSLLKHFQNLCLLPGRDILDYKVLFQTIENTTAILVQDDDAFFLRFIEDAIPYMEKYHYASGFLCLLQKMEQMLSNDFGVDTDRALLFDLKAFYVDEFLKNSKMAIDLEKKALSFLPSVTQENVYLVSNINFNLGRYYKRAHDFVSAKKYMENSMLLFNQYNLEATHDSLTQTVSYAILLGEMQQIDRGLNILKKLEKIMSPFCPDQRLDYATIQEAIGYLYLLDFQFELATKRFKMVLDIYREFYGEETEQFTAKKAELSDYTATAHFFAEKHITKKP